LDFAYRPDDWRDFYVALAGVSGALLGLIFVAVSLHLETVSRHPVLRNRVRLNLLGLSLILVIAMACLIPLQGARPLAVEMAVLWLADIVFVLVSQWRLSKQIGRLSSAMIFRTSVSTTVSSLGIISAITLWIGAGGGLLWNAVASVITVMVVIANTWNVSFGPELKEALEAQSDAAKGRREAQ
jgi:modulator of FtsH protease